MTGLYKKARLSIDEIHHFCLIDKNSLKVYSQNVQACFILAESSATVPLFVVGINIENID